MSIFNTKRRLVSLVSASAIVGTMAVAAVPAFAMAASPCTPTGFFRDGTELTAAKIGVPVTGSLDATGCDIGAYNPTKVANADIHGARYYGVVVNGGTKVNTTNSKVHQIGETPFDGTQHGRAILYINGADGTISGNKVYDFQKNGIEVRGVTADASAPAADKSVATIANNVITGRGHIGDIAQNGIVILGNASATVKDNNVSRLWYTGGRTKRPVYSPTTPPRSPCRATRSSDSEVRYYGDVTANVRGHSTKTFRPHGVRLDLYSHAKPTAQAELGTKLDWKVKVDGSVRLHIKQGFSDHASFYQHFGTGSGRHVIKVIKNGDVVRSFVARF